VEKAQVYITKDGIVQEKSFSASCYWTWRRLAGQMVLVNSIIYRQESLKESWACAVRSVRQDVKERRTHIEIHESG
jgi:hypothetical protein